jgi:UDP-N-acetylglucosamine/UDP-N-acetylgalactosamine diphosphorylase
MQKAVAPSRFELHERLLPFGQEHVLAFWEQLDEHQRRSLAAQLAEVDLDLVRRLHAQGAAHHAWAELAVRAEPPTAVRLSDIEAGRAVRGVTPADAIEAGEQALSAGKVGVILVAGGQGTRLGFDHPKGMYPIGPFSGASLFHILLEKILARSRRHGAPIPLYLMTSPATHEETAAYLDQQQRFGLPEQDVRLFCQGTMPAVDAHSGKLLLAGRDRLFLSPDGHGGMLSALMRSGCLDDIRRRGLAHLYYLQVDNPLAAMCDPLLVGYHALGRSELTTLVIAKRSLRDTLGNVVLIDGKLQILEYSDLNPLSDAVLGRTAADGQPIFWAGNTAFHVFDVAFLSRVADDAESLPFHVAKKAVPYLDSTGRHIEPEQPNALKFERFIFDLLPLAQRAIVVEADREAVFAPVKNASGEPLDSPETVQAQMATLARRWLRAAGAQVADDVLVEISPLWAQDASEVAEKLPAGTVVTDPRYFC